MKLLKPICPKGHDKRIVGRTGRLCKECQRIYNKKRYIAHPRVAKTTREYNLKHCYGITLEDYNKMFIEQNGLCKGCYTHASQLNRGLFVDHDHATGKVRGLLCSNCNLIARKHATPEILRRLADYIERS